MSGETMETNAETGSRDFIEGYSDSNEYSEAAVRAVLQATKASNALPAAGEDYEYYSSFASFRQVMLAEGKDILNLISALTTQQVGRGKYEGLDLEEKFDLLMDMNDIVLERVGNSLDEADGIKKKPDDVVLTTVTASRPIHTSWNKKTSRDSASAAKYHLLAAKNVLRPQLCFKDKVDNSNSPFVPIIKEKPNSIKPLAILVEKDGSEEFYSHPYECEIEHFQPSPEQMEVHEQNARVPLPLEETPYFFVSNLEELRTMCQDLGQQKEIAVDLEHHSYRTFQGITCLIQISTRQTDYIVDALSLRHELHALNEVFTDPKIVKVLHGADMDVQWLQRDFGVYLVGLFDTGQAARVLNFAHLSLAFLLRHYCGMDPNKQFQLADWRIRPLPNEMLRYAREDTHYLLYIYDRLKKDLLDVGNEQRNLLVSVFQRSKLICLKRYEKPLFREDGYLEPYKKGKKSFNSKQLYALKHLYSWRDHVARMEDESTGYVLPNHMILQISEILPRDHQGIIACCNPCPPLVRQNLNELHTIILKARELSASEQKSEQTPVPVEAFHTEIDLDSFLHSVHDFPRHHDVSVSLPTLLDEEGLVQPDTCVTEVARATLKVAPSLAAIAAVPKVARKKNMAVESTSSKGRPVFVPPYQRYKAAIACSAKMEEGKGDGPEVAQADHVDRVYEHIQALVEGKPVDTMQANQTGQETAKEADADSADVAPAAASETKKGPNKPSFEETEFAKPLRPQKPPQRKRKRKKPQPEIPLKVECNAKEENVAKRLKQGDMAEGSCDDTEDGGFQPFDYAAAQAAKPQTGCKKKKKWAFNPHQQSGTPMKEGKRKRTKKQVKSHTYSDKGTKNPGTSPANWPMR